jgi:hypothetical protein
MMTFAFKETDTVCFTVFGKLNFAYGGLILSSSQFFATAQAASKNEAHFKKG